MVRRFETDFEEPGLTDLDRWVGVPLGGFQPKEPISVTDIRRFAQAFMNPHPLYLDERYGAAGRFGQIVAPQSFVGCAGGGMGGKIPGSHPLAGGDEAWFYGPRAKPGERLRRDSMIFDYNVVNARFAGPTVVERMDSTWASSSGQFKLERSVHRQATALGTPLSGLER